MDAAAGLKELVSGLGQRRDPRVRGYLQSGPALAIPLLAYMALVWYGPRFMKGRTSPPLRLALTAYNIAQVSGV